METRINEDQWIPLDMPPVGKPSDFDKLDREKKRKRVENSIQIDRKISSDG